MFVHTTAVERARIGGLDGQKVGCNIENCGNGESFNGESVAVALELL